MNRYEAPNTVGTDELRRTCQVGTFAGIMIAALVVSGQTVTAELPLVKPRANTTRALSK